MKRERKIDVIDCPYDVWKLMQKDIQKYYNPTFKKKEVKEKDESF